MGYHVKALACLMASCLLVLGGCTSPRIAPEKAPHREGVHFQAVSGVEYDSFGRPVFGRGLERRPSEPGSLYLILERDAQGTPHKSYMVAVTNPGGPDMARPFNVLYKWTGKGISRAGRLLKDIFTGEPRTEGSEAEVALHLLVATTGVTVLVTGGIVFGVANGTWETGKEIGKLLVTGEEVLASFTMYEYDGRGRISAMRSYLPGEPPEEIISTLFRYRGDSPDPYETVTRSLPDSTGHRVLFEK